MPWTMKQHRLFEAAAHNKGVAKRVGIPQGKAEHMAGEGIKNPGNPAMPEHNPHPDSAEMRSHGEANFEGHKAPPRNKPDWGRERVGHAKSFASESKSVDWPELRKGQDEGKGGYGNPEAGRTSLPATPGIKQGEHSHTMGNKLPEHGLAGKGMREEPRYDMKDETRGTVELPPEQYSQRTSAVGGPRHVPQEAHGYVKHIANALLSARNRR